MLLRDERFFQQFHGQHCRIHLGRRVKSAGRDGQRHARIAEHLHAQRQQRKVARFGANALGYFLLNGQSHAPGFHAVFQQVADEGRGDVIRNIATTW